MADPQAVATEPPPPGPGVQPPFVAAPIEGRRARIGLGLGVAGALLAACCGVGGVATIGLVIFGEQAINEQAQRTVDNYLTAVAEQDWESAYQQRCESDQAAESLAQFTRRQRNQPPIESYQVGDLAIEPDEENPFGAGGAVSVPVTVTYGDGTDSVLQVPLEQDPNTGQFEVCGTITQS